MTKYMNKRLLNIKEELREEEENLKENKEDLKKNKSELFVSIITLISTLISQAIIIGLISILPKIIMIILLSAYCLFQIIFAIPVIVEFCKELSEEEDFINFTTENIEYIPFFLASILTYSLSMIILIINILGVSIPKIIITKHKIDELNKTVEKEEKLINQKKKEKEEKLINQKKKEIEEKQNKQNKIIENIDSLTEKCMLIDERYRMVFLKNLKCITKEYANRFESISFSDSKEIDLNQDNYEKLKSDICQKLGNLDFDIERVLEAQKRSKEVNDEAKDVMDTIDMYTDTTNKALTLRR